MIDLDSLSVSDALKGPTDTGAAPPPQLGPTLRNPYGGTPLSEEPPDPSPSAQPAAPAPSTPPAKFGPPITDPDTLKFLNTPPDSSSSSSSSATPKYGPPITDPDTLKYLNSPPPEPEEFANQGVLDHADSVMRDALRGGFRDLMHAPVSWFTSPETTQKFDDYFKPSGVQSHGVVERYIDSGSRGAGAGLAPAAAAAGIAGAISGWPAAIMTGIGTLGWGLVSSTAGQTAEEAGAGPATRAGVELGTGLIGPGATKTVLRAFTKPNAAATLIKDAGAVPRMTSDVTGETPGFIQKSIANIGGANTYKAAAEKTGAELAAEADSTIKAVPRPAPAPVSTAPTDIAALDNVHPPIPPAPAPFTPQPFVPPTNVQNMQLKAPMANQTQVAAALQKTTGVIKAVEDMQNATSGLGFTRAQRAFESIPLAPTQLENAAQGLFSKMAKNNHDLDFGDKLDAMTAKLPPQISAQLLGTKAGQQAQQLVADARTQKAAADAAVASQQGTYDAALLAHQTAAAAPARATDAAQALSDSLTASGSGTTYAQQTALKNWRALQTPAEQNDAIQKFSSLKNGAQKSPEKLAQDWSDLHPTLKAEIAQSNPRAAALLDQNAITAAPMAGRPLTPTAAEQLLYSNNPGKAYQDMDAALSMMSQTPGGRAAIQKLAYDTINRMPGKSPSEFLKNLSSMNDNVRRRLLDTTQNGALNASLDKIAAAVRQTQPGRDWAESLGKGKGAIMGHIIEKLPQYVVLGAAAGIGGAHGYSGEGGLTGALTEGLGAAAIAKGAGWGGAKIMTNPKVVNWIAKAPTTSAGLSTWVGALGGLAASDPDLKKIYDGLISDRELRPYLAKPSR